MLPMGAPPAVMSMKTTGLSGCRSCSANLSYSHIVGSGNLKVFFLNKKYFIFSRKYCLIFRFPGLKVLDTVLLVKHDSEKTHIFLLSATALFRVISSPSHCHVNKIVSKTLRPVIFWKEIFFHLSKIKTKKRTKLQRPIKSSWKLKWAPL